MEAMRIKDDGTVGIGTAAPAATLHVAGVTDCGGNAVTNVAASALSHAAATVGQVASVSNSIMLRVYDRADGWRVQQMIDSVSGNALGTNRWERPMRDATIGSNGVMSVYSTNAYDSPNVATNSATNVIWEALGTW